MKHETGKSLKTAKTARLLAFEILKDVREREAYANLLLSKRLTEAKLSQQDASFVTELVSGTLRLRGRYDRIIELASGRKTNKFESGVLDILRLGAHQALGMRVPKHAAVHESVALAKKVGLARASGLVNAVMRRVTERELSEWLERIEEETGDATLALAAKTSHPEWVIDSFRTALRVENREHELADLLDADNVAPLVSLVDLTKMADPSKTSLSSPAIAPEGVSPLGYVLKEGLPARAISALNVADGEVRVQDQGSQLAALALLNAKPIAGDEKWADLCAGPGGKTAVMAAAAKKHGFRVFANEVSEHRAVLVENATQAFKDAVTVRSFDGRSAEAFPEKSYDRILVDAPCSGLGALRRRPEARWRKTEKQLKELTLLQRELLANAAGHTAAGGVIAYVTCSPDTRETREIVDSFLRDNEDFRELNAKEVISRLTRTPVDLGDGEVLSAQLWPHRHETDAMFISLLQKVG